MNKKQVNFEFSCKDCQLKQRENPTWECPDYHKMTLRPNPDIYYDETGFPRSYAAERVLDAYYKEIAREHGEGMAKSERIRAELGMRSLIETTDQKIKWATTSRRSGQYFDYHIQAVQEDLRVAEAVCAFSRLFPVQDLPKTVGAPPELESVSKEYPFPPRIEDVD